MVLNTFLSYSIFYGQNVVRWFSEGQKFLFLSNLLHLVVRSPKQFYKTNTVQLELFCHVRHFLTNQMHPRFNTDAFLWLDLNSRFQRCYKKSLYLVSRKYVSITANSPTNSP